MRQKLCDKQKFQAVIKDVIIRSHNFPGNIKNYTQSYFVAQKMVKYELRNDCTKIQENITKRKLIKVFWDKFTEFTFLKF